MTLSKANVDWSEEGTSPAGYTGRMVMTSGLRR
jgi:hypothetical protein